MKPTENCSNGVDDDDDGDVDSADTECEECAPKVPAGWLGPAHVYVGAPGKEPSCGDTLFTGGSMPSAEALTCDSCSCSQSGTGSCALPVSDYVAQNGHPCGSKQWSGNVSSACVEAQHGSGHYLFGAYIASGRSCTPTGGAITTKPEPEFGTAVLGCGAPAKQGGCSSAEMVRPESPPGYSSRLCIAQREDVAECPDEYPERSSYAQGIDDQRNCSACTCDNNFACSGTLTGYTGAGCSGTSSTNFAIAENTCYYNPMTETNLRLNNITHSGSCLPSTSTPQGSIVEKDTLTICCR